MLPRFEISRNVSERLCNYIVIPGCAFWRRPGIHIPGRGYGFRARSLRSRPRMTMAGSRLKTSTPRRLRLLNRLPDLHRRQRRVQGLDAEFAERIHHAIGDTGRAADGAGFAAALGAQRVGAARRGLIERDLDRRNIVSTRQAVILIARGQQLPLGIVGDALVQRLTNALRDAAVNLSRHQRRIDGDADVVDGGVAHDLADAGFRIDLDLADMRAVRPARSVDLAFAIHAQARAVLFFRDVEQSNSLVGADHREHAVAIFDVL